MLVAASMYCLRSVYTPTQSVGARNPAWERGNSIEMVAKRAHGDCESIRHWDEIGGTQTLPNMAIVVLRASGKAKNFSVAIRLNTFTVSRRTLHFFWFWFIYKVFTRFSGNAMRFAGPFAQINQFATFTAERLPDLFLCPFNRFFACGTIYLH